MLFTESSISSEVQSAIHLGRFPQYNRTLHSQGDQMNEAMASNGNTSLSALQSVPAAEDDIDLNRLLGKPLLCRGMVSRISAL